MYNLCTYILWAGSAALLARMLRLFSTISVETERSLYLQFAQKIGENKTWTFLGRSPQMHSRAELVRRFLYFLERSLCFKRPLNAHLSPVFDRAQQ